MASGLVIAAPQSGAGKTLVTLGLARALADQGVAVAPAKTGPDYIDPHFLSRAARRPAVNLDPWAMGSERLGSLAADHAGDADMLLVEGVMGLFDGSSAGPGSTADLASRLGLPVVLVVDCARMGQSVAALARGFADHRADVSVAGIVLNNLASDRHEALLGDALAAAGIQSVGALRRDPALSVPDRHLGLVLPDAVAEFDALIAAAARAVARGLDIDALLAVAAPLPSVAATPSLPPLGQRIAIARDAAFAFVYEHWLAGWRAAGCSLAFFSPLADEPPTADADAVFLPGGYPELHAAALAAAVRFRAGLIAARDRGALVYGECGGYMALGRALIDGDGIAHEMAGLLPVETSIADPRRSLGYRRLAHRGPLPWPAALSGHEFHYAAESKLADAPPLFDMSDAGGMELAPSGCAVGRVCGAWAHVIDMAGAP